MRFVAKNFITILSLLVSIIVSVTAYAYKSNQTALNDKIDLETAARKEACASIRKELDSKVDESAFKEFKAGQEQILKMVQEYNNREHIYQSIIKELTFIGIDTTAVIDYDDNVTIAKKGSN